MNTRKRLLLVLGTRPEVIKQAPLWFAARESANWDCSICFTGQHREMGLQMLDDLGLRADWDLALMRDGQSPADFFGSAVPAIARVLHNERPDWIAVQGDTTTALAGALAGFYEKVPVLHIEAGLRTNNLALPFPEEGHRQLISRVSQAHAAPTTQAATALAAEGVATEAILTCGNTGIDCLLRTIGSLRKRPDLTPAISPDSVATRISAHHGKQAPILLVTLHRRESFGAAMQGMCRAIRRIAQTHPDALVVLPVHLNPEVRATILSSLGGLQNVLLIEPQAYTAFAWLLDRCTLIVTDSGGLQEEGPALGKPVLVLREATERSEAVACGAAKLIGCAETSVYTAIHELLTDPAMYRRMAQPRFPYGDGTAAHRILHWLANVTPHPKK